MSIKNIFEAISNSNLELVIKFIETGTDINGRANNSETNTTPLHYAIYHNRLPIVQYLVEHGADVYAFYEGRTALNYARHRDYGNIVSYLESKAAELHPWILFSPTKLAHTEVSTQLSRKITEIFNMESRDRLTLSENLETRAETISTTTSFDEMPQSLLGKIFKKFTELGGSGDIPESFVLYGPRCVSKSAATLPPQ